MIRLQEARNALKNRRMLRIVFLIVLSILLVWLVAHPRISEKTAISVKKAGQLLEDEGAILQLPSETPFWKVVVKEKLGFFDAIINTLFLIALTFVMIIGTFVGIALAIAIGFGGILTNNPSGCIAGCLTGCISPFLIVLGPFVTWILLTFQGGGTVAYYLIMGGLAIPTIIVVLILAGIYNLIESLLGWML